MLSLPTSFGRPTHLPPFAKRLARERMSSRGGRGGGFGRRGGSSSGGGSNTRALLARSASEAGLGDDRTQLTLEAITHPPLFPDLLWHSSGKQGHGHFLSQPPAVPSSSSIPSPTGDAAVAPLAITSAADVVAVPSASEAPSQQAVALSNPKRPTSIINLINKHREVLQAFNESSQFLRITSDSTATMDDVPRYFHADDMSNGRTQQRHPQKPDVRVLSTLGKLGADPKYFPAELLPSHDPPRSQRKKRKLVSAASNWTRTNGSGRSTRWEELAQRETTTASGTHAAEEDALAGAAAKPGKAAELDEQDDEDAVDDLPAEDEEEDLEDYTKDYYESEGESDGGDGEATF